ncbi:indoleamine 2,3-dioxygenase [Gammaproteobacteria bacterium]|jgi:indoleamine 2,3-dioxygenase|nr:indoleamine 2,3-dioxygenase [Gammaproteobacteria bacterium]MDA9142771.1 indoleamine 2,3-dioxygenase [Gammaproteobacteria bacterium]MDA9249321.1 indoleamine 2,3-dioxygenase [Gammaproteobacteria bacterium]MDA9260073.1 indoleamine 2,3-dioxygenase [Gammaproteobacteria bacterium]MDA9268716.1 indoleamine 2,3-dioxygenase [Gammaproteobacteria bacterium]|tara:strand:- start:167 stop:1309 length:1143 start_codon:yes stop_codon:yes gene_type:complete
MQGFLPQKVPSKSYSVQSESCDRIQEIASNLPKLLLTGKVQSAINKLSPKDLSIDDLLINQASQDLKLAMSHLSFIAHAYIWGDNKPNESIPSVLANPWVKVAKNQGRPPILSYASYCLDNWFLIDPDEPISLENVGLINNFLGGVDEDWFVTIHVCIENAAADAIAACAEISMLETDAPEDKSIQLLKRIIISMKKVNEIFARMPEKCDPYIYYHRVRPFIFGTKDNPDLKNGLIYKGEFESKPQFFRGETGAQSSIIPSLDGALQITHTKDHLRHYLNEMREYMPPKHREFMEVLEKNSQIKKIIKGSKKLTSLYNDCLEEIRAFRAMHLEYAGTYIFKQAQIKNPFGRGGSTITGTGGTPFMAYLKKHRDETEDQKK